MIEKIADGNFYLIMKFDRKRSYSLGDIRNFVEWFLNEILGILKNFQCNIWI